MKKVELVGALNRFADHRMGSSKGQDTLARFLAYYFNELVIPAEQKYAYWDIEPFIPQLLLGAFEVVRTSEDETVRQLRSCYQKERGRQLLEESAFLDLTNFRGTGVEQALTVQDLCNLFKYAIGADWVADKIDAVFNAEQYLLQQVFYKFQDRVFRRGLFQIADECPMKGMSGTFGETTLRTYMIAGRFMLTFARPGEQMEHSVSFVCGDDDPLGLGGGAQSIYTDLQTAIAMINDVMTAWPEDRSAQTEILKPDEKVAIG